MLVPDVFSEREKVLLPPLVKNFTNSLAYQSAAGFNRLSFSAQLYGAPLCSIFLTLRKRPSHGEYFSTLE